MRSAVGHTRLAVLRSDSSVAPLVAPRLRAVSDQMDSLRDSIPMKLLAILSWSEFAGGESALAEVQISMGQEAQFTERLGVDQVGRGGVDLRLRAMRGAL